MTNGNGPQNKVPFFKSQPVSSKAARMGYKREQFDTVERIPKQAQKPTMLLKQKEYEKITIPKARTRQQEQRRKSFIGASPIPSH
jgi:hypothetical protein